MMICAICQFFAYRQALRIGSYTAYSRNIVLYAWVLHLVEIRLLRSVLNNRNSKKYTLNRSKPIPRAYRQNKHFWRSKTFMSTSIGASLSMRVFFLFVVTGLPCRGPMPLAAAYDRYMLSPWCPGGN